MGENDRLGFLMALGQEFCAVLDPIVSVELVPQDGYEVFLRVLGREFDDIALEALTESQIAELTSTARSYLECTEVTSNHLREVVRRTRHR